MFNHRQFIAFSLALVVLPTSAHGWRPIPVPPGAARSDLVRRLPRTDRALVRRVEVQALGARRGRAMLRDEAFSLGSPEAAARITRAWAGRRSARVAVGRDGHIVLARGVAGVIWREGARVGLVILRQRNSAGALRNAAVGDARFADAALRAREPSDSWQRVLTGIDARGRVSRGTALAAFALAYGPLPGVRTPGGRHAPIPSGTLAALWALAYAPRLPAAQRAVIDRRLGVRTGAARAARAAHAAAAPGSGGDPGFVPNAYHQAVARNWQATYEQHLARPLGLQLVVGTSPGPGTAFADALPLNAEGQPEPGAGPPASCRIRMGPRGEVSSSSFQLLVLAHEVFHCFQFALKGRNAWQFAPPWILEGMADWAALTVDPVPFEPVGAGGGGGNIKWYIETPHKELFTRSYDAVGFWGHVADFTGPLWPRVSAILNATSDVAAFKAAEGAEDNVLSSWGSSAFRVSPIAGFAMHSPIEPPHFDQLPPEGLKAVWADQVGAPAYTTSQYELLPLPHVPLIHVAIDGPARLLTAGTEYRDLQDAWFCVEGEECRCPPDTSGSVPPTRPLSRPAYLGVTGDPDIGTAGVVESDTLAQFCRPSHHKPAPAPAPTSPARAARTARLRRWLRLVERRSSHAPVHLGSL